MDTLTPHQQLTQAIGELPIEILPELANFIEYLRFKVNFPHEHVTKAQNKSGSAFLLGIAGLGASDEDDTGRRNFS